MRSYASASGWWATQVAGSTGPTRNPDARSHPPLPSRVMSSSRAYGGLLDEEEAGGQGGKVEEAPSLVKLARLLAAPTESNKSKPPLP